LAHFVFLVTGNRPAWWAAFVLISISTLLCAYRIEAGKVQPSAVAWAIRVLPATLLTVSQLMAGVTLPLVLPACQVLGASVITVLALRKYGWGNDSGYRLSEWAAAKLGWPSVARLGMLDWLAIGGSAIGGLTLWLLRAYPVIAISIGIAINLTATLVHGRTIVVKGKSEDWFFWALVFGAAVCAGLTNGRFAWAEWIKWFGAAGTVLNASIMIGVIVVARRNSRRVRNTALREIPSTYPEVGLTPAQ
jgi:hypothetical protein